MVTTLRASLLPAALLGMALFLYISPQEGHAEEAVVPLELPPLWKNLDKEALAGAVSSDGKFVAVYEAQKWDVVVYHRDTGKEHFRAAKSVLDFVAFTPDAKHLVTLAGRQPKSGPSAVEAVIWDAAAGKRLRAFDLFAVTDTFLGPPKQYAVSDTTLVMVELGGMISAFDLATGKRLGDFANKGYAPRVTRMSRDGKLLLTADKKNELRLWDVEKRKLAHKLHDHGRDDVAGLAVSGDGRWCASCTRSRKDDSPHLWVFDAQKGELKGTAPLLMTRVNDAYFSPDGKTLYATGDGAHHGLQAWDWQSAKEIRGGFPKDGLNEYVRESRKTKKWNPGGQRGCGMTKDGVLLTMSWGKELRFWFDEPRKEARPQK